MSLAHTKEVMTSNILLLLVFMLLCMFHLCLSDHQTINIRYSTKYCVATAGSQVIGVNYITNCQLQVVIKYCFFKKSPYIVFYLVILFCAVFPYSKCVLSFFFPYSRLRLCYWFWNSLCSAYWSILFYVSIIVHPFLYVGSWW